LPMRHSLPHSPISSFFQVPTLIPALRGLYNCNKGIWRRRDWLMLHGTVAITHKGMRYNIPVEVHVDEGYPEVRSKKKKSGEQSGRRSSRRRTYEGRNDSCLSKSSIGRHLTLTSTLSLPPSLPFSLSSTPGSPQVLRPSNRRHGHQRGASKRGPPWLGEHPLREKMKRTVA